MSGRVDDPLVCFLAERWPGVAGDLQVLIPSRTTPALPLAWVVAMPQAVRSPMKKTFQLHIEGKNSDRVLDAVKHEIRKYIKRERGRPVPAGADFWDFDCKFGRSAETAEVAHLAALIGLIDGVAREGGAQFYVEILAKGGHRQARSGQAGEEGGGGAISDGNDGEGGGDGD